MTAGEVAQGYAGACAGADLVGAQGQMGRHAGQQQGGHGDQPAAPGDGVNEAAQQGGAGADQDGAQAESEHALLPFLEDDPGRQHNQREAENVIPAQGFMQPEG